MATMRHAPRPLTAKVRMEVVYDDNSKEIIETTELDISSVPSYGGDDDTPHLRLGVETPWDREPFRPLSMERFQIAPRSEFCLDIRLPAKNGAHHLYTTTKIDPPDTRVGMVWTGWELKPCFWTEEEIQQRAAETLHTEIIYFFLDIP